MIGEMAYFVRRGVTFAYDVVGTISPDADPAAILQPSPQPPCDYLYQVGFSQHIGNHEVVAQYRAKTRDEIRGELLL
jgi:hypothetical protein